MFKSKVKDVITKSKPSSLENVDVIFASIMHHFMPTYLNIDG